MSLTAVRAKRERGPELSSAVLFTVVRKRCDDKNGDIMAMQKISKGGRDVCQDDGCLSELFSISDGPAELDWGLSRTPVSISSGTELLDLRLKRPLDCSVSEFEVAVSRLTAMSRNSIRKLRASPTVARATVATMLRSHHIRLFGKPE